MMLQVGSRQGCRGGLVRTGKYKEGDEDMFDDDKPDYVFDSLLQMAQHVVAQLE